MESNHRSSIPGSGYLYMDNQRQIRTAMWISLLCRSPSALDGHEEDLRKYRSSRKQVYEDYRITRSPKWRRMDTFTLKLASNRCRLAFAPLPMPLNMSISFHLYHHCTITAPPTSHRVYINGTLLYVHTSRYRHKLCATYNIIYQVWRKLNTVLLYCTSTACSCTNGASLSRAPAFTARLPVESHFSLQSVYSYLVQYYHSHIIIFY